MNDNDPEFAKDLLRGAEEIAQFLYADRAMRRKVYHLVSTSNLHVFKLGSMICARRSWSSNGFTSKRKRRYNPETALKIVRIGKV
jgi:hypothetical protein